MISIEMTPEELALRNLAADANLKMLDVRTGNIGDPEIEQMQNRIVAQEHVRVLIQGSHATTVRSIASMVRKFKRKHRLLLLVIDYLQLMGGDNPRESREEKISSITRGLKVLAGEEEVSIVLLSQVNRELERRDDKRPRLADLRESGAIEQDADRVLLLFREEFYLRQQEPSKSDETEYAVWHHKYAKVANLLEVIVAKQRQGTTGKVTVRFDGSSMKFNDLEEERELL